MAKKLLCILISILFAGTLLFCSCGKDKQSNVESEDPTTKNYENGISYDEEFEDAKLEFKKAEPSKFYGKWEAKSGDAHYLFGNIDIEIKKDGTWTGNIADDDMKGTWKEKGNGIEIINKWITASMYYTKDDVLILQQIPRDDDEHEDVFNTVLTKK
ncbi:MAG: hypothetical protein Q4E61_04125 [Alphaproteobacteria bacterium]|nr:hypothetical protein [Alphaproteobacteria bacterium]